MNLPPKTVNALVSLKARLVANLSLPSAAHLDSVAEERQIRKATTKTTTFMRHARTAGRSWQAYRRRQLAGR